MPAIETPTSRVLPKVALHEHLDGSLRIETLFELLHRRGLPSPAATPAALAAWFEANAHAGSLEKYLEGFGLTVAAMATPEHLARVAFEAAEDARADSTYLAEFRIAPLLFEPHGLPPDEVVQALVIGLQSSPIATGLIVCAMRDQPVEQTERAARLAVRHLGRGVVGFDLAGAEAGHPPEKHARALAMLREAGVPLTLHAGEADVAERVIEAARLGARRIGHGVRLADALADPQRRWMVDEIRERGVHLEVCPTSNVHTGAARSIAEHPIVALWNAGVSLSYQTDNRLMSCITHASEAAALLRETPLTEADLLGMAVLAARASFLDAATRARCEDVIREEARALGLATPAR